MRGRKPELRPVSGAITKAPPAPKWLSIEARSEWKRIMPDLVERRLLVSAMLGIAEKYCVVSGQVRQMQATLTEEGYFLSDDKGKRYKHPALQVLSDATSQARQYAAELGLTPTSRTKTGPASEADDELSGLDF